MGGLFRLWNIESLKVFFICTMNDLAGNIKRRGQGSDLVVSLFVGNFNVDNVQSKYSREIFKLDLKDTTHILNCY